MSKIGMTDASLVPLEIAGKFAPKSEQEALDGLASLAWKRALESAQKATDAINGTEGVSEGRKLAQDWQSGMWARLMASKLHLDLGPAAKAAGEQQAASGAAEGAGGAQA